MRRILAFLFIHRSQARRIQVKARFAIALIVAVSIAAPPLEAAARICQSALETGTFVLTRMGGQDEPDRGKLRAGLNALLSQQGFVEESELEQLTEEAVKLHSKLSAHVEDQRRLHGVIQYTSCPSVGGPFASIDRMDVEFPSLMKQPSGGSDTDGHPSDRVRGIYLVPRRIPYPVRLPTLVLVHSALDEIDELERKLAEALTAIGPGEATTSGARGIGVFLVYLPHFGPRRVFKPKPASHVKKVWQNWVNADFISVDLAVLRRNFEQAVLDLHEAVDWLQGMPMVQPDQISLLGMSLGGIVSASFAGIDPGRISGYALFGAGGNLPSVLDRYRHAYQGDPVSIRWTSAQHSLREIRFHLAPIDPLVWAHRAQASRFLYIGSKDDQLVTWENSVRGFLSQLNARIRVKKVWLISHNAVDSVLIREIYFFRKLIVPVTNMVLGN
jgi:pimeloyl-ACP methyl ester carboxylesterase